jgi:cell division protein FtsI (penicillin-binding protein 3)
MKLDILNNKYIKKLKRLSGNLNVSDNQYLHDSLMEESLSRVVVVIIMFCFVFAIIIFRLFDVMLFNEGSRKFAKNYYDTINFGRKEIVDRNGTILAVNLNTVSLFANTKLISDPSDVAKKLHDIFPNISYESLLNKLKIKRSFIWIKRNITPKEQYAVNKLGMPALDFEHEKKRFYPHGSLFAHVLGYAGVDGVGLSGVEKFFDKFLSDDHIAESKLELSLDVRVQNVLKDELYAALQRHKSEAGVGIVMDVNNGELLGLVSLPDFDLNEFNKANSEQLFNRATKGLYELGSVVKVCTLAMALDSKSSDLNDVYYVKDPIKISRFKIRDYKPKGRAWLSVPEIFMYSSNIGVSRISNEFGPEIQQKYISLFNLDKALSIEIPEVAVPTIPSLSQWGKLTTMTISYGHGLAITPLHMASITGAIVNGGDFYMPTLVKKKPSEVVKATKILNQTTVEKMKRLMYMVVQKGTGRLANKPGYFVAGKTGSGEKPSKGGYSRSAKLSSFVGVFPIYDPKYVVFVILDDPKPTPGMLSATGGAAAAPLAGNIIERIAPILDIKPKFEDADTINQQFWLEYDTEKDAATTYDF